MVEGNDTIVTKTNNLAKIGTLVKNCLFAWDDEQPAIGHLRLEV